MMTAAATASVVPFRIVSVLAHTLFNQGTTLTGLKT
jgi:hypothetical protein